MSAPSCLSTALRFSTPFFSRMRASSVVVRQPEHSTSTKAGTKAKSISLHRGVGGLGYVTGECGWVRGVGRDSCEIAARSPAARFGGRCAQVCKLAPHGSEKGVVPRQEGLCTNLPVIRDLAAPQLAAELVRADDRGQQEQQHRQSHEPGQGRSAGRAGSGFEAEAEAEAEASSEARGVRPRVGSPGGQQEEVHDNHAK